MKHDPSSFASASPAVPHLYPSDFVKLLHPHEARGKSTIMLIEGPGRAASRTYDLARLPFAADVASEGNAYITVNRFHGPRRGDRIAELNAVFLDLDFHKLDGWKANHWQLCALRFQADLETRGIPQPSFLMHSGRGLYAIWLLEPLPAKALPRWSAAVKALIELYRPFGADRACSDATRVFRLPLTVNRKSGATVKIIGGMQQRHKLVDLSDRIYRACGRPTRAELKERKAKRAVRDAAREAGGVTSRGLPPAARFRAIKRDLDRICAAWGGVVPHGLRNTWLHLQATCLTHYATAGEIADEIRADAARATPDLSEREVEHLIRSVARRADMASSASPAADGRLHYSGATIAELLGISDELARTLELEQVYSQHERGRRRAERERERRAADGAASREGYLATNSASRDKPWVAMGVSRATYYRRRAAASADAGAATDDSDETGSCPLQGGFATPKAMARKPRSRAFGTLPPPGRTRPANLEIEKDASLKAELPSDEPDSGARLFRGAFSKICPEVCPSPIQITADDVMDRASRPRKRTRLLPGAGTPPMSRSDDPEAGTSAAPVKLKVERRSGF